MSPLPLFELTRGVRAQSRTPDDDQRIRWFYPHGQFARGAYRALLARSQQTVRHVSYPDNAMFPVSSALFRFRGTGTVSLVASCGQVLDEDEAASFRHESVTTPTLSLGERVRLPCTLRVVSDRGEPPALRSLIERGDARDALQILRKLWGGMLEAGAQTFWEEFPVEGEPHEQMYGRPFGKSLCHGWASGPAELLPLTLLGTRPLVPGWAEFTVSPDLGDLDWAAAVIPAPAGDIAVVAEKTVTTVAVPRGTTLVVQEKRINGPALHRW
ncbi:hypothetical protein G7Y41_09510 [Schaalia sp. ZJ405]|uniref:alpha-L-rhamnosidase C-terminal domain-containing protein n=1 Tax=Schaalia sp. ZJ405 TaxID=2709403 RepID=UPI0013EBE549|nr:alpha-L-rhamnosidase C-terminal domain-containing protein [Schaalia sp. ZJ405]QPK81244.1 hypothetical protein G7Y41_09510 [Schaalia sp. ZJ405]